MYLKGKPLPLKSALSKFSRRLFQNLKVCKLWHIESYQEWKLLVKLAFGLEKLFLWNMVIADHDLEEILVENPLTFLQDIRIGCDEIGFIRLSEDSVLKLINACKNLMCIGGICEWKTRDLFSLLQKLLIEGGWRISLDPSHFDSALENRGHNRVWDHTSRYFHRNSNRLFRNVR